MFMNTQPFSNLKTNQAFRFILFLCLLVIFWKVGAYLEFDFQSFKAFFQKFPLFISGGIYVVLYVALTTFIWVGPKDILRVVGAVLFGATTSTILITIGEIGNATIFFHMSRFLGRDFIVQKFKIKPRQLDHVDKSSGFLDVFSLRVNLAIPFRFLDLGTGLTQIPFQTYLMAILLASPLRIFIQQYILASIGEGLMQGKNVIKIIVNFLFNNQAFSISLLVYCVVMLVLFVYFIKRKVNQITLRKVKEKDFQSKTNGDV